MGTIVMLLGTFLPILAASLFYVSDSRAAARARQDAHEHQEERTPDRSDYSLSA